jgi:tol-pal system protein YbgF
MTNVRVSPAVALLVFALMPVAAQAQSRQEMQVLEDLRMLQEQVQQLRGAVAALAEQAKAANTRLDLQAEMIRTNHANDSATLASVQTQVTALGEKMSLYSQQVGRFSAEIPSLRAGQEQQQKALDKIVSLLVVPAPTSPADVSAGAPPALGTQLPASPTAAFTQAKNLYAQGDYPLAVTAFEEFVQKFPEAAAYLGEARYWIGMAQYKLARYPAAVTAFQSVIETYKTSEEVPNAYFQLGECYRAQGKRAEALAAYDQVIRLFPDSSAALQAKASKGTIK